MVISKNSKRDKIRMFTPKYRRKVIYNQYRSSLGEIFHRLCSYKGVEII
ncbi:transposase, partial [Streptococcus mitis]